MLPEPPVLLVAAHGTASALGTATTRALVTAVAAAIREARVELCFLDVAEPSLAVALDAFAPASVVVVPLQLSAGYHVHTDIPNVVAGRSGVRVASHLGADPLLLTAVADRLAEAVDGLPPAATTVLAGVGSSLDTARAEFATAAETLAAQLHRSVHAVAIDDELHDRLAALPAPVDVASYLLAEGAFATLLDRAAAGVARVARPVGTHPALVALIRHRYEQAVADDAAGPAGEVG